MHDPQHDTERRLRQLVENVTDYAIYMLDPDGYVTSWNAGAERISGYPADEVIGEHVSLFHTEEDRQAGAHQEMLRKAEREGRLEMESWRVRKDGSRFLAHIVIDPVHDEAGGLVGFAKVTRDITERHRAREAEHASEAKTQFLASMSHEIRTPLNGIIGYAERLMDEDLSPAQRRYAERIQTAGSALLIIINDILDLSQIEAGRIELEDRPFFVHALVDNTLSIITGAAEAKGLSVEVVLDPDLPKVLVGDEGRLRQVLLNLLNNAVKFTREGGVRLTVLTEWQQWGRAALRFSVSDTGIGIPEDKRHRLFRRFSQIDRTIRREFGGTGLGLAISKRLVDLMGGEIGVESEVGKGSTFWIRISLPVAEPEAVSITEPAAPAHGVSARILLAEDLEFNQELARSILERAGHHVDVVSDGAEAVAAVKAAEYDIVLMDIQMPVMDGISATRQIRSLDHPTCVTPIIAMTANVMPAQVRSFKEAGMDDHIGKPMRRSDLLEKVGEWLPSVSASMASVSAESTAARAVFDQQTFDDLRNLVGANRMPAWLRRLHEQLETAFPEGGEEELDRETLRRASHAIVSQAGGMGFFQLSDLCRELEDACLAGRDLSTPVQKARHAAREATDLIARLMGSCPGDGARPS